MESNPIRPVAELVPPLNSMPYVDPVASVYLSYDSLHEEDAKPEELSYDSKPEEDAKPEELSYDSLHETDAIPVELSYDSLHEADAKPVDLSKSALLYFPSRPSDKEWRSILSVARNGIGLSGSAAAGTIGPVVGKMDIGQNEESYIFRVSLPGVARENFTCDVTPDGQILIKGVTTTGEKTIYKHSLKFDMQSQNLCPPGLFSISFKLPGPVDSQHFSAHFGTDGIFEGLVKKKITTS